MSVSDCDGTRIPPCSCLHRGSRNQHLSHWTNSLLFGLDFRRLKQDVHVFYHKGSIKATKRMLHRTVWFWEFALPPVPWCHCRLLLGRLPAALGTSMTAPFCTSRTAPGAPSSSKDTSRSAHEEDNVQSHDQRTYILWGSNHRKRMPAHWFTEQVDADRNWNLQWFVSTCCLWTAVAEERWIAADLTISDGELVTFDGCSWVKNLKS